MLEYRHYLVKRRGTFFKVVDAYQIFDAETGELIGRTIEEPAPTVPILGWFFGFLKGPAVVEVREPPDDSLVFSITRARYRFRTRYEVKDSEGGLVGYFRGKVFSISGSFKVHDAQDREFAELKSIVTRSGFGSHFRFLTPDGIQIGEVKKKFKGAIEELTTLGDAYKVEIAEDLSEQPLAKMLLLAAALAIDIVFKEKG